MKKEITDEELEKMIQEAGKMQEFLEKLVNEKIQEIKKECQKRNISCFGMIDALLTGVLKFYRSVALADFLRKAKIDPKRLEKF